MAENKDFKAHAIFHGSETTLGTCCGASDPSDTENNLKVSNAAEQQESNAAPNKIASEVCVAKRGTFSCENPTHTHEVDNLANLHMLGEAVKFAPIHLAPPSPSVLQSTKAAHRNDAHNEEAPATDLLEWASLDSEPNKPLSSNQKYEKKYSLYEKCKVENVPVVSAHLASPCASVVGTNHSESPTPTSAAQSKRFNKGKKCKRYVTIPKPNAKEEHDLSTLLISYRQKSHGFTFHKPSWQSSLCYSSRDFRKMNKHIFLFYWNLIQTFEVYWSQIHPLSLYKAPSNCYSYLIFPAPFYRLHQFSSKQALGSSQHYSVETAETVSTSCEDPKFSQQESVESGLQPYIVYLCCGGKDMIALDWLPFICRFFHFTWNSKLSKFEHQEVPQNEIKKNGFEREDFTFKVLDSPIEEGTSNTFNTEENSPSDSSKFLSCLTQPNIQFEQHEMCTDYTDEMAHYDLLESASNHCSNATNAAPYPTTHSKETLPAFPSTSITTTLEEGMEKMKVFEEARLNAFVTPHSSKAYKLFVPADSQPSCSCKTMGVKEAEASPIQSRGVNAYGVPSVPHTNRMLKAIKKDASEFICAPTSAPKTSVSASEQGYNKLFTPTSSAKWISGMFESPLLKLQVPEDAAKAPIVIDHKVAFILVDYPGYGMNNGSPTPEACVDLTMQALMEGLSFIKVKNVELRVIGYSLGAAVALKAAKKIIESIIVTKKERMEEVHGPTGSIPARSLVSNVNPSSKTSLMTSIDKIYKTIFSTWITREGANEKHTADNGIPFTQSKIHERHASNDIVLPPTRPHEAPIGNNASISHSHIGAKEATNTNSNMGSTKNGSLCDGGPDKGVDSISGYVDGLRNVTVFSKLLLIAPFTSTVDCASFLLKIPSFAHYVAGRVISFMQDDCTKWDNVQSVRELFELLGPSVEMFSGFGMHIVHGYNDTLIPPSMGHKLFEVAESFSAVHSHGCYRNSDTLQTFNSNEASSSSNQVRSKEKANNLEFVSKTDTTHCSIDEINSNRKCADCSSGVFVEYTEVPDADHKSICSNAKHLESVLRILNDESIIDIKLC